MCLKWFYLTINAVAYCFHVLDATFRKTKWKTMEAKQKLSSEVTAARAAALQDVLC